MDDLTLVTYCGLYCGLCGERARIPARARALRETLAQEGYESWGTAMPGFIGFWEFLTGLCDPDTACPGCRRDGGPPVCGIRKCARRRAVDVCPLCDEFPCARIEQLGQGYPTLIADGRRMAEIGLEAWIAEQEQRAATGFAYGDIRCHPYQVPEE